MPSSKYFVAKRVVVPSAAQGVRIGVSKRMKSRSFSHSWQAAITSDRILRIACCRFERIQRWRRERRKSTPCSFFVIGYSTDSPIGSTDETFIS
jgi:hypothetical protein